MLPDDGTVWLTNTTEHADMLNRLAPSLPSADMELAYELLDEDTKGDVETTLIDLLTDQDVTCLIVTHDEAQARRLATRALRMKGGRIVTDGPVEEVLES